MSIKVLKSRGQVPWGAILAGTVSPTPVPVLAWNLVVRLFTAGSTTEVAKTTTITAIVGVHKVNDTTNTVTTADATDQTTVDTLLNDIKAKYNAHRVSTTFHSNADNTNAITSADATNLATSETLANEIKTDYNAHRSQVNVHPYADNDNLIESPNGTNLATTITLANEEKLDYNAHRIANTLSFTIYGITPGTYDVGIKSDASISNLATSKVFTAGDTTLVNFGLLYIGELTGDDSVDISDALIAISNSGFTGGCYGYPGDWLIPDPNTFGTWTVIPTARRKTY